MISRERQQKAPLTIGSILKIPRLGGDPDDPDDVEIPKRAMKAARPEEAPQHDPALPGL